MRHILWALAVLALCSGTAGAGDIRVVTDIAPVQSLVARVMQGAGRPAQILRAGETPHDFALRPSTAKALQGAQLVFWMGPALLPSLAMPVQTLPRSARVIDLSAAPGVRVLEFRDSAVFEDRAHGADHAGDHGEDHGKDHREDHVNDHDEDHRHGRKDDHDDHDDHDRDHDDDKGKSRDRDDARDHDRGDDRDHDDDHVHGGADPHMWLDPENARLWLRLIAEELSREDPANAGLYRANAEAARADLAQLIVEVSRQLAPLRQQRFVVFHDAYRYFETRFGLSAAAAILMSDGSAASAARLHAVQERIARQNVACVFTEPQFNPRLLRAVAPRARAAELDPMGVALSPGPELYPALIRQLATAMAGCLGR